MSEIKETHEVMLRVPLEKYEQIKKLGITNGIKVSPQCLELITIGLAVQATDDMRTAIELILRQAVLDSNETIISRLAGYLTETQRAVIRNEALLLYICKSISGSDEIVKKLLKEADEEALRRTMKKSVGNDPESIRLIQE